MLAAPATHAKPLQKLYAGPSALLVFDGEHNSPRPRWAYDQVVAFASAAFEPDPLAAARALVKATGASNARPQRPGSEPAVEAERAAAPLDVVPAFEKAETL